MQYITEQEIDRITSETCRALAKEPKISLHIDPVHGDHVALVIEMEHGGAEADGDGQHQEEHGGDGVALEDVVELAHIAGDGLGKERQHGLTGIKGGMTDGSEHIGSGTGGRLDVFFVGQQFVHGWGYPPLTTPCP